MQIRLCLKRGILRLLGDKTFFIVTVLGNLVISLVLGSVYFDLPENAESMNSRCSVLFFAILFNGLSSALEVSTLAYTKLKRKLMLPDSISIQSTAYRREALPLCTLSTNL